MKGTELIELAGLATSHAPALLECGGVISAAALEQYWSSSKCRQDRWSRALRQFQSPGDPGRPPSLAWSSLRDVLEEIILSELLTRVWTAVLTAYDRRQATRDAEPIARSVLLGHLEARHRTLALLVAAHGVPTEEAVRLNRLRHRIERWTDMLLAHLQPCCDVGDFTFDPSRADDFAGSLSRSRHSGTAASAWALTLASLYGAFHDTSACSPNDDLNARIGQSVLASFPGEMFDGLGLARTVWLTRITNAASDAEGMIEALLKPELPNGRAALEANSRWPRDLEGGLAE
jgi:hypothetical protein